MDFTFQDRVPTYPNRYKITKADGTSEYITLERADEPSVVGTALNANTFNTAFSEIEGKLGSGVGGKSVVRNLLDNSDFTNPVNQRGLSVYNGIEHYCIDRWTIYNISGKAYIHVEDGCIRLTEEGAGWTLYQYFEAGTLTEQKYTLAWCDIDGNIEINTNPVQEYESRNCQLIRISGSGEKRLVWAALYEGEYTQETLPKYQPKGYTVELLECQRYFLSLDNANIGYPATTATEPTIDFLIPIPTKMRIDSPTMVGNFSVYQDGVPMLISDFSVVGSGYNAITIRATDTGGYNVISTDNLALKGSSGAGLSADL